MTAVVLTYKGKEYDGHGSGVFIGDGLLLTNHHVVVGCDRLTVVLHDGRQLNAKVIAVGSAESTLDLAVLQVEGVERVEVASLVDQFELLDEVYSFGFPSLALKGSAKWDALMNGDQTVRPDVVASAGVIQQAQRNDKNVDVLIHSAIIRGGNSGGALVDKCGRLVGINTWTRGDKAEIKTSDGTDITIGEGDAKVGVYALVESGYNIAITSMEVMRFLTERSIPYQSALGACR